MLVAAIAVPLARRLGQPAPVLFAALGLAYGVTATLIDAELFSVALDSYDQWFVGQLAREPGALIYVFLPPLLFEMTLAVNVRRLLEDAATVLTMAILAVVAATALIGVSLWLASPIGLFACLLLGAAVATTDPGAVISTFREIGAPRRLLVILEGESLLNDAAAIAIFGLLLAVIRQEAEPSALGVALDFLYSFGAGAGVGLLVAAIASIIYPMLERSSAAEASVTVAVAYGAFLAAEQVVGGSGVVAVVFAGLATGSNAVTRMGPGNWITVRAVWAQIGFWSNALIMLLATSLVPGLLATLGWQILPYTVLVYIGASAARAAILFGLLPLMAKLKLTTPLSRPQNLLLIWGGVRGSVTLVLAISIADVAALGDDAKLLAAVAASYSMATIFLNASTLAWLTRRLGLNRLSSADLALRERIVAGALERVRNVVRNLVRARHLEPRALAVVEAALGARLEQVSGDERPGHDAASIPLDERVRIGLAILAGQEARLIRRGFEEGAVGRRVVNALRLDAERIGDGPRTNGAAGYSAAARAATLPSGSYKGAVFLQRFTRMDRSLREAIETHFVKLLESERVVRELEDFAAATLESMIGQDAVQELENLLNARHGHINNEIEAVAAQYPHYAQKVEETLVARAALRRERQQYVRLFNDSVIGQELYDDLIRDLDRREHAAARPPRLDLTLTPRDLLARVNLFVDLDARQRRMVARALKTRFATPGQIIRDAGARGQVMYFIASGAVDVSGPDGAERLGTGRFFGEGALVAEDGVDVVTVRSLGYSRLLALQSRDFKRLARRDPGIDALIRAVAVGEAERRRWAEARAREAVARGAVRPIIQTQPDGSAILPPPIL